MPPPLLTSNNVFFATSLWSYTKYDSNLLYQITSGLCVLQILKLAHFSILLKKWIRYRFFETRTYVFRVISCVRLEYFHVVWCPSSHQMMASPLHSDTSSLDFYRPDALPGAQSVKALNKACINSPVIFPSQRWMLYKMNKPGFSFLLGF